MFADREEDDEKQGVQQKQNDRSQQSGEGVVTEDAYDVNCIVNILGRSVTDDIVYGGFSATDEELTEIEDCKLMFAD